MIKKQDDGKYVICRSRGAGFTIFFMAARKQCKIVSLSAGFSCEPVCESTFIVGFLQPCTFLMK